MKIWKLIQVVQLEIRIVEVHMTQVLESSMNGFVFIRPKTPRKPESSCVYLSYVGSKTNQFLGLHSVMGSF